MKPTLDLRLYAILDPALLPAGRDPVEAALAAVQGGATIVQLRDKRYAARPVLALARALVAALRSTGVPLVIDDRVDIALASGASGVHLGRDDLPAEEARRLLGPDAIIGVTVHHAHEADAIDPAVCDYAGIGPVYATKSKDPGDPPLGPQGLARLTAHLRARLKAFPVVAIAGIGPDNAAPVIAAGADGVAVIAALFTADDIAAAAGRLRAVVDAALKARGGTM